MWSSAMLSDTNPRDLFTGYCFLMNIAFVTPDVVTVSRLRPQHSNIDTELNSRSPSSHTQSMDHNGVPAPLCPIKSCCFREMASPVLNFPVPSEFVAVTNNQSIPCRQQS